MTNNFTLTTANKLLKVPVLVITCWLLTMQALPSMAFAQSQNTTYPSSNISKGIVIDPQMLKITPGILEMTLIPGKTQVFQIKVQNLRDEPVGLMASIQGFDATDEDTGISLETPRTSSGVASWSKLELPEKAPLTSGSILQPKSTTSLTLTITTPVGTKDGSYPGLIVLTPLVTRPLNSTAPRVVGKIALPLFASVGREAPEDLKEAVTIPTFTFDQKSRTIMLRVTNDNKTMINTKPFLTIHALGANGSREQLVEKHILPTHTRRWIEPVKLPNQFPYIYSAQVDVSVGGGEYVQRTRYFTTLPIDTIIVVLILIILGVVIFRGRRRLKKAFKALRGK